MSRPDFLPDEVLSVDLSAWSDLLPDRSRLVGGSLFADLFLADGDGAIHMLEVSAGSIRKIAGSEAEFLQKCAADDEGWLLKPLAERCRAAGMTPTPDQCYAFTTLPLFGGKYEVDNIWLSPWAEWIRYTATMYVQTKHLPDGSKVRIIVEPPN